MYRRLFYYIKLSYKVNSKIGKGTSLDPPLLFLLCFWVLLKNFIKHKEVTVCIFLLRTEPESSYKIAHKWCF